MYGFMEDCYIAPHIANHFQISLSHKTIWNLLETIELTAFIQVAINKALHDFHVIYFLMKTPLITD